MSILNSMLNLCHITSYTDNSLIHDFTYYYRILAFNEDGESDFTEVLETKTLPLQPPDSPSSLAADTVSYNTMPYTVGIVLNMG